jgi:predicted ester cyclase
MTMHDASGKLQHVVEEINRGNMDSILASIAPDFYEYSPADDEPSATAVFHELASDLKAAMPDLRLSVADLEPDGDAVRGRLSIAGTKDGPLWGSPSSGNAFRWDVDIAMRPKGDGIAVAFENVVLPEILGALRKLDLVPPPDEMDKPTKYPVSPPEILLKVVFNGGVADKPCEHLDGIRVTEPTIDVCEECVASGDIWPALRLCLTCGYVGCCDTSKNKHARAHYEQSGHPLIRSIRLEEGWIWCYLDNAFFTTRTLNKYR